MDEVIHMQKLYKDFFSVIKIALSNEPVTLCDDIDYEKAKKAKKKQNQKMQQKKDYI